MKWIFVFLFFYDYCNSQELVTPLDIPLEVAGNFCELRSDHFHAGIDFRTRGIENLNVYAIDDGILRRVAISPYGYGKVLYIDHPKRNITSVYAHLNQFNPRIELLINQLLNHKKSNYLDTTITDFNFQISKKEIIGLSGNTGSSNAPHLHFEIRDLSSEKLLNPESFFKIKDEIPPVFNFLLLYNVDQQPTEYFNRIDIDKNKNTIIEVPFKNIGLAISAKDFYTDYKNTMGVYRIRFYKENQLIYQIVFDHFLFSNQSQINAITELKPPHHQEVYKLFKEPCGASIFEPFDKGFFQLDEHKVTNLKIEIEDFAGSVNVLNLKMQLKLKNNTPVKTVDSSLWINCDEAIEIYNPDFELILKPKTIPSCRFFTYQKNISSVSNPFIQLEIFDQFTPCLRPFQLRFNIENSISKSKLSQIYLNYNNEKQKKKYIGTLNYPYLDFENLKYFGKIELKLDSNPPQIQLINLDLKKNNENRINFIIFDEESGISDYHIFVNNKWQTAYYDPKIKMLFFEIPKSINKKLNKVQVEVVDLVGNSAKKEFELVF